MKRGHSFQVEARRQASVIRQRMKWDMYPLVKNIVKRLLCGEEEVVRPMHGKGLTDVMASFYGITRSPGPRRIHRRSGRPYPLPYSVRDGPTIPAAVQRARWVAYPHPRGVPPVDYRSVATAEGRAESERDCRGEWRRDSDVAVPKWL
ncbi:hypothetical+protein [Salmonella phage YSD1]|uniref:Hypothetical+protein n=1 Tax=Salmonella phage YSD1 TaxID=2749261 RepID=A0A498U600_9CAUD|nr:hypothetical+protein [Salmonella phage YSD1]VCU41453.1 hypothetical+protein [Salmonella phage YSD1]